VRITPEGEPSKGQPGELLIPDDPDERQTYALRIVAQRCLYGVDKNPLAAEMAKLSLWLLTLAKDKPFEFLDHAIRSGDSLVGIHNLDQLRKFNLDGKGTDNALFLQFLDQRIKEAVDLRLQITSMQANTVEEVEAQERLLHEANEKIERLRCAADMLIGAEFLPVEMQDLIEEELKEEGVGDENEEEQLVPLDRQISMTAASLLEPAELADQQQAASEVTGEGTEALLADIDRLRSVRQMIRDAESALCRYGGVSIGECSYVRARAEQIDGDLREQQRDTLPVVSQREQIGQAAWPRAAIACRRTHAAKLARLSRRAIVPRLLRRSRET
jgi:hypothetical protein